MPYSISSNVIFSPLFFIDQETTTDLSPCYKVSERVVLNYILNTLSFSQFAFELITQLTSIYYFLVSGASVLSFLQMRKLPRLQKRY